MINIVIDNYIRVSGLPRSSFDAIIERLTYPNPKFINALKYGQGNVRWIPRTVRSYGYEANELWLPRGYYMEFLAKIVAKSGFPYQIVDLRHKDRVPVPGSGGTLRSYQEKMIQEAMAYPGPGFIMQAPPGTGKTFTGLEFARRMGRRTLWITHTKELANQTREAAAHLFNIHKKDIGLIGQGKFGVGQFLTIATVQTLHRQRAKLQELKYVFGTVIVDEVHHAPATSWHMATHMLSPEVTFGLTATSYRNDGLTQMMYDCMGPVVTVADKEMLVKEGVLIVPSVLMMDTGIYLPGINYSTLLSDMVDHRGRNAVLMDVIRYVRQNKTSNNTLMVLSARRKHVELLTHMCIEEGLEPLMMLGEMSALDRTLAAEKIKGKATKLIIATYKLLSEGFDYPPINFVLFATPFKDSVLIEQCIGRAQRIYEGKQAAFILDSLDINPVLQKQARIRNLVYRGLGMDVRSIPASAFQLNDQQTAQGY
jgi:superfamily II DNA or RNA helicase